MKHLKPTVLVSACLEFQKVRYNGQVIPSKIVRELIPFVNFIQVCPEVEIGLGVPRDPIRIVKKDQGLRLIQPKTKKDLTIPMKNFSKDFINNMAEIDGCILKEESPSMGVKNIKVYSDSRPGSAVVEWCAGLFANEIQKNYQGYPIEESDRLRNNKIRDHFLTKLFLFKRLRSALENNQLDKFKQENKYLIDFYNAGQNNNLNLSDKKYISIIKKITRKAPYTKYIYNFFKKLTPKIIRKEKYKSLLQDYKENRISYETLKSGTKLLLSSNTILSDYFFEPYPKKLIALAEDDRQRDYWKIN